MKKYLSSYWIRSAFFVILQRFSITLFSLVNFIILIRYLSKPEMGVWTFFLMVTTLFETAKSSLLKNAHVKYVGSNNEEKTSIASSSLLLNSTLSAFFILFLIFFSGTISSWLGTGTELEKMLIWFIPGMIFMIVFSHLEAVSQSHLDFKSIFAGQFVRQITFFVAILTQAILGTPFSLIHIVVYQSISIATGSIALFIFSRKHLLYVFDPSIKWVKELLGFGGYIFGIGITSTLFANLDQLMIGKFTLRYGPSFSQTMVANYNAAIRIGAWVDVPSYAAAEILLPKVSQVDVKKGYQQVTYMYERMVAILLCFTVPAALFIFFFPKLVITIIAGAKYVDASFILQMYMLSALIKPIQNQAANVFLYIGKARLCFLLNLLFLGVNSGLNFLCFKQFGPYGAAIGNVIGCVLGTLVWYSILHRSIDVKYANIGKHVINTYKTIYSKVLLIKNLTQVKSI